MARLGATPESEEGRGLLTNRVYGQHRGLGEFFGAEPPHDPPVPGLPRR